MSEYGLPTNRDSDGELKPVDHTYEYAGDTITIKMVPPTITQQDEYEDLGAEVAFEDLNEIVERHIVKPDVENVELTTREVMCYLHGINDYGLNGGSMAQAVQEELEQRSEGEGN